MPVMLPGAYRSPYTETIARLMMRQGDIAAQGAERQGQIWGNAVSGLGQIGAQAYQQHQEQKQQKARTMALDEFVQSGVWAQDPKLAVTGAVKILGPEQGVKFAEGLVGAAQMSGAKTVAEAQKALPMLARGFLAAPPDLQPKLYGHTRELMINAGLAGPNDLPEQWMPELTPYVKALSGQDATTKTRQVEVVNPDGSKTVKIVADTPGQEFTSAPVKPDLGMIEAEAEARARGSRKGNPQGDSGPDAAVSLTSAALDIAARRYLADGTLPPMGMGKASGAARQRIINRAAEIDPSANIAGNRATFEANKASLTGMQKMVDSVSAFERTASQNAKILDGLLDKIPNYGSSWANKPARSLSQVMGSEDMAAFNTIRQSVANEYARIISNPNLSGVMSDSAREEGAVLLDPNATAGQIRSAIKVLASEAKNRHTEYQGQLEDIKGRLGGKPASEGWKDLGNGVRIREKK